MCLEICAFYDSLQSCLFLKRRMSSQDLNSSPLKGIPLKDRIKMRFELAFWWQLPYGQSEDLSRVAASSCCEKLPQYEGPEMPQGMGHQGRCTSVQERLRDRCNIGKMAGVQDRISTRGIDRLRLRIAFLSLGASKVGSGGVPGQPSRAFYSRGPSFMPSSDQCGGYFGNMWKSNDENRDSYLQQVPIGSIARMSFAPVSPALCGTGLARVPI
jgi:hypothetical protein